MFRQPMGGAQQPFGGGMQAQPFQFAPGVGPDQQALVRALAGGRPPTGGLAAPAGAPPQALPEALRAQTGVQQPGGPDQMNAGGFDAMYRPPTGGQMRPGLRLPPQFNGAGAWLPTGGG